MPDARRSQSVATISIAVLATAMVVAGLVTVGGPAQGRMEQRDSERISDLRMIEDHLNCIANEQGALPSSLAPTPAGPGDVRISDPHTDAPYRYEIIDPTHFRICAEFEVKPTAGQAERQFANYSGVDPVTGCMTTSVELSQPAAISESLPPVQAVPDPDSPPTPLP